MTWIASADVQAWLGVDQISLDDAADLAEVATQAVRDTIERDLSLLTTAVEVYDSLGTDFILLNNWPVRSIGSVSYNGQSIVPAGYTVAGWRLSPDNPRKLVFTGIGKLNRASQNITLTAIVTGYDTSLRVGSSPLALPGTVYNALRLTAAAIFNAQAADPNLTSESTSGVFSGSFHAAGVGAVPPGALTLLRREMRAAP